VAPLDRATVLRDAGRQFGLEREIDPFTRVHRNGQRPGDGEVMVLVGAYLELLETLSQRLARENA
jgi:hypothetical protein